MKCDQCSKSYGQKTDLQRHMKIIHEGIKEMYMVCGDVRGTCGVTKNGANSTNQFIFISFRILFSMISC